MNTVVLTISGPSRRADLAAPADTPIEDLLPTFVEMAGPEGGADGQQWAVGVPGRAALSGDRTLEECGIVDGAVLELRGRDAAPAQSSDLSDDDAPFEPGPGSPSQRTARVLPARLGRGARLIRAAQAALRREEQWSDAGRSRSASQDEAMPMPSAVTVPRPSPPLDRARASWQETDYLRRLDEAIATPRLRRCATIAVVSPKGGVGKTTITALLGSLLAYTRRDRAVAVDTNPDYGSLGRMLTPGHEVFVDDLLDLLKGSELTATQLDARLGRGPDGLLVLPAPTQPSRMARLDRNAYQSVIEYLKTKAGVLLLDCGTGLQEPAAQAAIFTADQLLLVSDAEPATATLVAEASGQLFKSGVPVMLVVNKVTRRGVRLDLESLERLVPDASGMATLDAQPAAAGRVAASTFTWRDPAGRWEESVRQLAVALVSQWDGLGLTAHEARAGLPK